MEFKKLNLSLGLVKNWKMVLKIYKRIKKALEEFKDMKLNRELVGIDKFGNKYYQYFSYYGLPTRREVEPFDIPMPIMTNHHHS